MVRTVFSLPISLNITSLFFGISGEGSIQARYFAITCIGTLALQDRFFAAAFKRLGAIRRIRSLAILETDQLLYDFLISAEHELRQTYSHLGKRALTDPLWDLVGYSSYADVALGERLSCPYPQDDPICSAFPHEDHLHVDNVSRPFLSTSYSLSDLLTNFRPQIWTTKVCHILSFFRRI